MDRDYIYNRLFVVIPVLLAIFEVIRDLNYVHLGYLLLIIILVFKYLYNSKPNWWLFILCYNIYRW